MTRILCVPVFLGSFEVHDIEAHDILGSSTAAFESLTSSSSRRVTMASTSKFGAPQSTNSKEVNFGAFKRLAQRVEQVLETQALNKEPRRLNPRKGPRVTL